MEDRRIVKTKTALKQTLADLLQEKAFEEITVTELCRRAGVGRITFYAHYADKYALVEEICQDLTGVARTRYHERQRSNNAAGDPVVSHCNLLESILDLYSGRESLFRQVFSKRNPYLQRAAYRSVVESVERRLGAESKSLSPRYSLQGVAEFLCNGMRGFITRRAAERATLPQIRAESKELLKQLLTSGALMVMFSARP